MFFFQIKERTLVSDAFDRDIKTLVLVDFDNDTRVFQILGELCDNETEIVLFHNGSKTVHLKNKLKDLQCEKANFNLRNIKSIVSPEDDNSADFSIVRVVSVVKVI